MSIPEIIGALQTGRLDLAERLARQASQAEPANADIQLLLAISLHQQQRVDEALAVYAGLAEQFPDDSVHVGNYATALRDAGRGAEAEASYRRALELDPGNFAQWLNLGVLQLHDQRFLEARETLLHAVELDPESPAARVYAARACMACHDNRAAELYRPWRQWLPLEDPVQYELAELHLINGDAPIAAGLLEALLERSPRHLHGALLLANVYERMNRAADARRVLDGIEANHRDLDAGAHNEIAHQRAALAARDGDHAAAREQLEAVGPRHAGDYAHYFSLARACDKLKQSAAALSALEKAHALQMDEYRAVAPQIFEPGTPIWPLASEYMQPDDLQRWPPLIAPDASQSPLFVVGFPRSGTTMLEQMLDAHPALQSMDERPFMSTLADRLIDQGVEVPRQLDKLDQTDCDNLRKTYLELTCTKIERRWDAQLVDKNPLSMLMLPLIHRMFPNARFILALRHPCDVLLSNYMQSFRFAPLAIACSSLTRLAEAYVEAMRVWLHHVELLKPDVLVSRYEDLVADTAAQTRRIADFLQLEDATPMLGFDRRARDKGFIATPSYQQVIEPVNRKGLNRWHAYREAFEPVLPILQPMLEHWGYGLDAAS